MASSEMNQSPEKCSKPDNDSTREQNKEATKNINEDAQVKIIQAYNKLDPHVSSSCCTGTDDSIIFHYFQILKAEATENEVLRKEIHEREAKFEIHVDNLNDDIEKGVHTIVNDLSRKISEDQPCFYDSPVGFGSFADGTKLGPHYNEFDFIIPLKAGCKKVLFWKECNNTDSRKVSFTDFPPNASCPRPIFECEYSGDNLTKHIDVQILRKYFGEMILKHMPQVPLPSNFKHAGFQLNDEHPTFSGYRIHGPAFMLQFYYKTRTEEILITIDLVPAFAVQSEFLKIYENGNTEYSFREVIRDEDLPATIYVVALVDSFGISMPRLAEQLLKKNDNFVQKMLRKLKILTKELLSTDPDKIMNLPKEQIERKISTDSSESEPSQTKQVKLDILLRLQKYSVSAAERPQGIVGELYEPWTPISSYALKALLFRVMRPIYNVMNYDENEELAVIRLCMLVIVYNCFKQYLDSTKRLQYSWELNQYKFVGFDILPFPSAMLINEPMSLCWHSLKIDLRALLNMFETELKSKVSSFENSRDWSQYVKY